MELLEDGKNELPNPFEYYENILDNSFMFI